METIKYSRESFDGYTHRFKVKFRIDEDWRHDSNIDVYSNSDDKEKLETFINENKKGIFESFEIMSVTSKESDDLMSEFLEEFLKDI